MNETVKQKRSKAMDMRYYWVQDRIRQKQLHIYWAPGKTNQADYQTKHHSSAHHQRERPIIVHTDQSPHFVPQTMVPQKVPSTWRGCVDNSVPSTTRVTQNPSTDTTAYPITRHNEVRQGPSMPRHDTLQMPIANLPQQTPRSSS